MENTDGRGGCSAISSEARRMRRWRGSHERSSGGAISEPWPTTRLVPLDTRLNRLPPPGAWPGMRLARVSPSRRASAAKTPSLTSSRSS
eukprot:scaffold168864_cov29-Tisochrysis_lutea.AAC.3